MDHDDLREIFPGVFFVQGTGKLTPPATPFTMAFSRNMVVIREANEDLTLVNSVRLDEEGLKELEKLGDIKHTIRIAGVHGMDDAFYKDKYGATVWSVTKNYFEGVVDHEATPYMVADRVLTMDTKLPIEDASVHIIDSSKIPEGFVLLKRDGDNILIAGDCFQNWDKPDRFFNYGARIFMRLLGFVKAFNVGPAWYKAAIPKKKDIQDILKLPFEHVLPAHGEPVIKDAPRKYKKAVDALKEQ